MTDVTRDFFFYDSTIFFHISLDHREYRNHRCSDEDACDSVALDGFEDNDCADGGCDVA